MLSDFDLINFPLFWLFCSGKKCWVEFQVFWFVELISTEFIFLFIFYQPTNLCKLCYSLFHHANPLSHRWVSFFPDDKSLNGYFLVWHAIENPWCLYLHALTFNFFDAAFATSYLFSWGLTCEVLYGWNVQRKFIEEHNNYWQWEGKGEGIWYYLSLAMEMWTGNLNFPFSLQIKVSIMLWYSICLHFHFVLVMINFLALSCLTNATVHLQLIDVGFFVCLDSFLSLLTIMPMRMLMALWRLLNTRLVLSNRFMMQMHVCWKKLRHVDWKSSLVLSATFLQALNIS